MNGTVALIDAKLPNDSDVATLKSLLTKLSGSMDTLSAGINTANENYDVLTASLAKVNDGLKTTIFNTSTNSPLVIGINELEKGEIDLAAGLRQGSAGQSAVISSMANLKDGVSKITKLTVNLQMFL